MEEEESTPPPPPAKDGPAKPPPKPDEKSDELPAGPIVNSIGMRFVRVPAGKFLMGSPDDERKDMLGPRANAKATWELYEREGPRHEVEITKAFHMGVHEVTQKQYAAVMGKNPSWFSRAGRGKDKVRLIKDELLDDFPVEQVTHADAMEFVRRLSERERNAGRAYRLPTEAEWEYACRAGTTAAFHYGKTLIPGWANMGYTLSEQRALGHTRQVGFYKPNAFGLCDMHGNVWERCSDWFDKDYYKSSPRKDPQGPKAGAGRVLRGGCWFNWHAHCRSAYRTHDGEKGGNLTHCGLRLVCVPAAEKD